MQIVKYPDDTSYAIAKKLEQEYTEEGIRMYVNRPRFLNDLTVRVNTYEQLWYLNQIIDSYNVKGVIPTITIPWLIDKILYKLKIRKCCEHEGGGEEYIGLTKIIKLF